VAVPAQTLDSEGEEGQTIDYTGSANVGNSLGRQKHEPIGSTWLLCMIIERGKNEQGKRAEGRLFQMFEAKT